MLTTKKKSWNEGSLYLNEQCVDFEGNKFRKGNNSRDI